MITPSRKTLRGFTLIEVSVCVAIVGVMFAAVMQTVGQSGMMQYRIAERTRGSQLARMLMNEITQQYYCDPTAGPGSLGANAGKTRATYNDVDDYAGLSDTPPVNKDGSAIDIPQPTTWRRTTTVAWVDPKTLATSVTETGVKKVTVNVYHNGILISTMSAIRTNAP